MKAVIFGAAFLVVLQGPVRAADPLPVNRVVAVVAGQVITQQDVLRRINERPFRDADGKVKDHERTIKAMIDEALLVHSIRSNPNYQEKPGSGEELINHEVRIRYDGDRTELVKHLRAQGKTVEQRMRELLDEELVQLAQSLTVDSIQVSPGAVEQYLKDHPEESGQGPAVKAHWIRIAKKDGGPDAVAIKAQAAKLKTLADFQAQAKEQKAPADGSLGWVYANDPKRNLNIGENTDGVVKLFVLAQEAESLPTAGSWDDEDSHFLAFVEQYEENRKLPGDELRRQVERRLLEQLQTQALDRRMERLRRELPWRRLDN